MEKSPLIKSHKQLAEHVAGKRVLHLNSLGKDSILTLEWLCKFASCEVISLNYNFIAAHPDDEKYLAYLKRRFPGVMWIQSPNTIELNLISDGTYQSPIETLGFYNNFEYENFSRDLVTEEIRKNYACDFVCVGESKYEGFARAASFYKHGLVKGHKIYPLGLMTKEQVYGLIKKTGIKLHPCYKYAKSSFDHPSYWKMRSAWIADPEYKKTMLKWYPLLALDEYRYERLMK